MGRLWERPFAIQNPDGSYAVGSTNRICKRNGESRRHKAVCEQKQSRYALSEPRVKSNEFLMPSQGVETDEK